MATYVEPERWNDKSKESTTRSKKLKAEVAEGQDAQRYNYVFGTHTKRGRDNYDATNKVLNMKEEESEALDQRALDQYPKGTTAGSRTSRNRAGHGKPVDLPDADTGKKEGGMAKDKVDPKNAAPQDVPEPSGAAASKGYKPEALGSGIRVDGKPVKPEKKMAKGGMTASSRADGCAQRGKTRGTMIR